MNKALAEGLLHPQRMLPEITHDMDLNLRKWITNLDSLHDGRHDCEVLLIDQLGCWCDVLCLVKHFFVLLHREAEE